MTITEKPAIRPSIPMFYKTKAWQNSPCTKSLFKRLEERIEEVKKKLPNMTLKEKREMWLNEPYYEVSKLIVESKDWEFPKSKDRE